jgi:hypothetical protein
VEKDKTGIRMEKTTGYRSKQIKFHLSMEEWTALKEKVDKSTCRKVSEYIRKAIFGKLIRVCYRNRSMDMLVDECIALRKEMQAIREAWPDGALELDRLIAIQDEIQSIINKLASKCMRV